MCRGEMVPGNPDDVCLLEHRGVVEGWRGREGGRGRERGRGSRRGGERRGEEGRGEGLSWSHPVESRRSG